MTMVAREPMNGYPQFDITPTSGTITMAYGLRWIDISDFLYEVFPPNSSSNQYATEADPFSGKYHATSVKIDPFMGEKTLPKSGASILDADYYDNLSNAYKPCARAIVTYSSVQSNYDKDTSNGDPVPFLSHSWSVGGEFITLEAEFAKLSWGRPHELLAGGYEKITHIDIEFDDGDPDTTFSASVPVSVNRGVSAGFFIPTIEHQIRWHRVVSPPFEAIRDCTGCINSDAMTFATKTILPQTLMFLGAEISRDILSNGTKGWEVSYRFSERRIKMEQLSNRFAYTDGHPGGWISLRPFNDLNYGGTLIPKDPDAPVKNYDYYMGGITYGGWNHFYDQKTGGFMFLLNEDDTTIFVSREFFPQLFTQVP